VPEDLDTWQQSSEGAAEITSYHYQERETGSVPPGTSPPAIEVLGWNRKCRRDETCAHKARGPKARTESGPCEARNAGNADRASDLGMLDDVRRTQVVSNDQFHLLPAIKWDIKVPSDAWLRSGARVMKSASVSIQSACAALRLEPDSRPFFAHGLDLFLAHPSPISSMAIAYQDRLTCPILSVHSVHVFQLGDHICQAASQLGMVAERDWRVFSQSGSPARWI